MRCTNNACPLRHMCALYKSDSKVLEFFQFDTFEGQKADGTPRESYGCKGFEKAKKVDCLKVADELYGKLQPTEKC